MKKKKGVALRFAQAARIVNPSGGGMCGNLDEQKFSILRTASSVILQSREKRAKIKLEIAQKIMLKYRHAYQISKMSRGRGRTREAVQHFLNY